MIAYEPVQILLVNEFPSKASPALQALQGGCRLANRIRMVSSAAEALDFLLCRGRYAREAGRPRPSMVLLGPSITTEDRDQLERAIRANTAIRKTSVLQLTPAKPQQDAGLKREAFLAQPITPETFQQAVNALNDKPLGAKHPGTLRLGWMIVSEPRRPEPQP